MEAVEGTEDQQAGLSRVGFALVVQKVMDQGHPLHSPSHPRRRLDEPLVPPKAAEPGHRMSIGSEEPAGLAAAALAPDSAVLYAQLT